MKEKITREKLAGMIDHTCLKPYADRAMIETLCREADEMGCAMVAVNSGRTRECAQILKDSPVHVGAAIAFPLGQMSLNAKLLECEDAIKEGADEIDYVVRLDAVKDGNWDYLRQEMERMTQLCHSHGVICKVIFETCYLEDEEIRTLARIAKEVRPDFIKTSTGFGTAGADPGIVRLMKETVGDAVGVKAAGGIRSFSEAMEMIEAGASRIGTSSAGKILEEYDRENENCQRPHS